jgi:hypothetical protein
MCRRGDEVRWKSAGQDVWAGWRWTNRHRVKIGVVQRYGNAWFWGPRGSVHWLGPAASRADAQRRCEADAVLP